MASLAKGCEAVARGSECTILSDELDNEVAVHVVITSQEAMGHSQPRWILKSCCHTNKHSSGVLRMKVRKESDQR